MPFDAFIGNSAIIARLRSKLMQERLPHGLIFSGPEGVGKRTCALMTAKALNCRGHDFCGTCPQCRKIDLGVHPDVTMIGLEDKASEIKIAQVRRLVESLDLRPLEGRNKVVIIDPADALNPAAANALLKSLEEPPDDSFLFLLTTNAHKLLPTLRSRCQTYHFTPLAMDELLKFADAGTDELVLRWSRGSVGRLRSLDAAALRRQRDAVLDFLETSVYASETDFQDVIHSSEDMASKQDFESNLEVLCVLLSDLLYLREGAPEKITNIDAEARLRKIADEVSAERLLRLGETIRTMEAGMKGYANLRLLTDVFALTANQAVAKILNDNAEKSR